MTKKKYYQINLKIFASLIWVIGFLISGVCTQLHAASAPTSIEDEQNLTITGTVISAEDNMSIPGVNVIVKGSSTGAVTDFDGNYSVNVPANATLIFSYLGFVSQEIIVGSNNTINVTLQSDLTALDEVIIVGFGTQKEATLTGSVIQVKGDDVLRGKSSSSAALALQGEVPGLVVTRSSSRPGNEGVSINIRGDISVNNISPLILLDGLEIPEWQLSSINANDIETYSVLKDGAAAIFGTKAAGGVILITTKKGKKGKMQVTYKGETQINMVNRLPVASLKEYAQILLQAGDNDAVPYVDSDGVSQVTTPNYRFFTRDQYLQIIDGTFPLAPTPLLWYTGREHYFSEETNQIDAVYGTTYSERHDLSLSGGDDRATYRTSLGYANERSPISFVYDGAKKYNFRTNLNYVVSDMIKTDFTVSYDNRTIDEPTQAVGNGLQDANFFPLYNPAGQYYDNWSSQNVLSRLDEGGRTKDNQEIFRLGGKITLDLNKYVEGLSLNYLGNMSSRNSTKTIRTTSIQNYDWDGTPTSQPTNLAGSSVEIFHTKVFFQNHVFQADYKRSFGNHNIGVMVGATAEESQSNLYRQRRSNMLSDDLDDINTGDPTTQVNGGRNGGQNFTSGSNAVGLLSYIGKFNYDFDGILLFEALGRRDGSSRLHPDYRWKNFFNASAGINIHKLGFMENNGVFNNLKFRASYGETGSVTGIGEVDYVSQINTSSNTYFGADPSIASTGYISGVTTTDRTWERVANTNFGLDFAVLNSRLSGKAEIYNRKNNDMLISITYPQVFGATAPKTNSGDFNNNGWEFSLNWKDQKGDFRYNVGLSFWDSRSEVTRMEGASTINVGLNPSSGTNANIIEGKPLNAIYTYISDGLFQNETEVLEFYNQYGFENTSNQNVMKSGTIVPAYNNGNRLIPGSVRRVDVNGDGVINTDDLVYFGDANAHNQYGINLGLGWKGFDFSAFFQGVGSQNIDREGALSYPMRYWYQNQNSNWANNTWTADNPNSPNPVTSIISGTRNNWNYGHTNDINVIKASYLRAKVISLGYSLPQTVIERVGMNRVRLSITGNDLFVISNVNDGLDPENTTNAGQGSSIPFTSSLIFGLELTF